jgi:peptidoglycan/xylan/chitin deacetylase (PgdA/CDA1 family)
VHVAENFALEKGEGDRMKRTPMLVLLLLTLCLIGLGVCLVVRGETSAQVRIPVLLYHHILPDAVNRTQRENPWTISTENFEAQMQYLYDNNFHTLTHAELEDFLTNGTPLPPNSVMIHFDDGYYSNFVYAYPILKRFGHRATVFMITYLIEDLGIYQPEMDHDGLTWTAAHTMWATTDVFEFASHTHAMHSLAPYGAYTLFYLATSEEAAADTRRSFAFLDNHTAFAYPRGQYNDAVIEGLQAAGITMAFTTTDGYVTSDCDPFRLNRFKIWRNMTIARFAEIVSGAG